MYFFSFEKKMCRKTKFGEIAYQHALNSTMNFRHGAIITKGSKIIVSAHNHNRSTILGQIHTSAHAEIAVASKLINQYVRKKTTNKYRYKTHLKKYVKKQSGHLVVYKKV